MAERLTFEWEPLDPVVDDDDEPAENATFASLKVSLQDAEGRPHVLTRLVDRHSRSFRETVQTPLVDLVSWIVRSWNHLALANRPAPLESNRGRYYLWSRTRCWSHAGGGLPLPDLRFVPWGDEHLKLQWFADPADVFDRQARVRFIESGEIVFETSLATIGAAARSSRPGTSYETGTTPTTPPNPWAQG